MMERHQLYWGSCCDWAAESLPSFRFSSGSQAGSQTRRAAATQNLNPDEQQWRRLFAFVHCCQYTIFVRIIVVVVVVVAVAVAVDCWLLAVVFVVPARMAACFCCRIGFKWIFLAQRLTLFLFSTLFVALLCTEKKELNTKTFMKYALCNLSSCEHC